MKDWIELEGKLVFDVQDKTKKHQSQSTWKKSAIVLFVDDLCEYYSWLIKKRYNLALNKPIRGSHYTVVNDKFSELINWDETKAKYDGIKIKVYYNPNFRSNSEHWWFKAFSIEGNKIRKELGLGWPYFNPHITVGLVNNRNQAASDYAIQCEKRYGTFMQLEIPEIGYKYLK